MFWRLGRRILRLRYRVEVSGLDALGELSGPTLVMPNHPGYIDPPLVLSHLHSKVRLRPVVFAGIYRIPVLRPLMRLVNALEVPELSEHSHDARQQTLVMIDTIVAGLERGDSFLIYPSGRVQRGEREELGAARAAAEILARCPQANVVLVRTRGLWGSRFTFAFSGRRPHLGRCVLQGVGWMLANLLFFAPRRKVTMTVEVADPRTLPAADREALNRHLEQWYNRGGPEPPTFVPPHFLVGPRTHHFPDLHSAAAVDASKIPPATIEAVNEIVAEHLKRPLVDEEQQAETTLEQLGLDSLDRMDIALVIEDRFGFRSDQVAETLGQLWELAAGLQTGGNGTPAAAPEAWRRAHSRSGANEVLAETLAEAFVRRALAHPRELAVADRISGALTYRRLLVGARLLGKRLKRTPGDAVGVMLPASVAADVVFFALHLAGKLPVMLNWTTGPANLAHAVTALNIRRVVTSRKLIDRLGIRIAGVEYEYLEDLRAATGKLESLVMLLATGLLPGRLLKQLPRPQLDDPAVVLFTSGSESTPKAVPLSHRNLVSNIRGSLKILGPGRNHTMLGFLPPFHSFGLTGTLLAPILAGFRVVHHPDPTDAGGLVRTMAGYQASLLVTTPTFLSYMLSAASADDFRSVRTIVTGAEKCPETVFARTRQLAPQATILEGYGITECAPVVAGNRPGRIKPGTVGQPLDGVEVCVVDPESKCPLDGDATGLLLVRGPSIFPGYLNYHGPDPFVEVSGKRWYVTGDLVQVDGEGYLHFRGRLKRFLKVGGEMVSLPALEEPFQDRFPPAEAGPQVAVEGIETPTGRWIVLFSVTEITLREANAVLAKAGFRGVMRLDEVVRVESLPVLGTGKTDYKVLRKLVVERASVAS
jgi:long-chain-fatty-acid--[acyl-carrier-protein] ligase